MRFEGKHRFFKRVVHDAQNLKNVLLTLARRHQYMMAYHLSSPSFFKPYQHTSLFSTVLVSQLPEVAKQFVTERTDRPTVDSTEQIIIDGTAFCTGSNVSVGFEAGLPQFCKIDTIILIHSDVVLICRQQKSDYVEHLRAYELWPGNISVHTVNDFNDSHTLSAYNISGRVFLTPRRFISR